ncbi:MAG: MFS transporter [Actinomycetota bacterium]
MATAKKQLWNRSTIALITCTWTSACASVATVTALGLQVFDLTGRELDLGLLGLAEFAPSALLVLVTGTIADRYDRRRISSIAAAVEALTGVGLALYAFSDPTSVAPIFLMVIAFGAGRAFLAPSNRALPADIVAPADLPWLTARRAIAWQTATIAGPIMGGILFDVDPALPYVLMAVLLSISSASMFFVQARLEDRPDPIADIQTELDPTLAAPPASGRLREAVEGLRFIRRSPVLLGVISLDLFAVLFGGAVALLPALADRLAIDSGGVGALRAAGGIGAALTTLWIARKPIGTRVGKWLLVVVAIFGASTVALGATTSFVVALIAMFVIHGADAISVFIRSTLVPLITPSDKRGRVLAVESVFIGASNELGAFESGVVGQALGAPGAIIIGGAATLVVAGTYWAAFPSLREVDRFPE